MLKYNIDGAWVADNNETLNTVIATMNKNNIRYTRYAFKQKGGLFDQNILKKGKGQVPIKANDKRSDMEKYGGYNKASSTYFSLVKFFDKKGKKVIQFVPINLYNEKEYQQNPIKYVSDIVGFDCEVLLPCIKYNATISIDGFRMHLSSKSNGGATIVCKSSIQLVLGYDNEKYIKGIVKALQNGLKNNIENQYNISKENNLKLYDLLIDKIENSVFKVKYGKLCSDMLSGREKFESLNIKEQFVVLNEILKILHCNVVTGDLKLIGGSGKSGIVSVNSAISNIKGIKSIKIINQSITGLFEQEKELLTL
nr:Cas9 endonuclease PAM-interacting domain-containing protein [uncultured Eubacterium sp.]